MEKEGGCVRTWGDYASLETGVPRRFYEWAGAIDKEFPSPMEKQDAILLHRK